MPRNDEELKRLMRRAATMASCRDRCRTVWPFTKRTLELAEPFVFAVQRRGQWRGRVAVACRDCGRLFGYVRRDLVGQIRMALGAQRKLRAVSFESLRTAPHLHWFDVNPDLLRGA